MTAGDDLLSISKCNSKIKRRLEAVVDNPCNRTCADCPEGDPRWASLSVGLPGDESKQLAVLCCSQCRSLHQELGDQVCLVKSLKAVDQWTESEVEALERSGGNSKVNKVYESRLTSSQYNKQVVLEDPSEDAAARLQFIRQKYQDRTYFDTELYLALLEEAASVSKPRFTRSQTHEGVSAAPRHPAKSLSSDANRDPRRKQKHKAHSFRGLSDESDSMTYSLPTHLGSGSRQRTSSRTRSSNTAKATANASNKTRRGRRKTCGDKVESDDGLTSSSSSPCMSRWETSPPKDRKNERWTTESKSGNFSWGDNNHHNNNRNGNTHDSSFSDITALRDSLGNNGFKPRAPQRVLSDESADDNTRHERRSSLSLRLPSRVLSDEDDSSRRDRAPTTSTGAPLRMPRRIVSDDSGGEDTDRLERTLLPPLSSFSTSGIDPKSILSRRRSLSSLNLHGKDDEDSIRNQYGGPNFVFSGHRERTTGSKVDKRTPKYGIKLKYGFDSATDDTDSERKNRRSKPKKELERPKSEEFANVPTLGCLLAAHPEAPTRILLGEGSAGGAATSDEEEIVGADTTTTTTTKACRRKHRRSRSNTKLSKKGELWNHLNAGKKLDSPSRSSNKVVALTGLEKISSDVSLSGFSFQSGTDDDVSLVRPKALVRGRSCGGLGLALASASGMEDSGFTIFSRSSIDSNPALY